MKIAIQLYTLRNVDLSFPEVLKRVKSIGYDGVEFAGFHNMKASDLKALLDEIGLEPLASHTSIDQLNKEIDEIILYNRTIGNNNIVIPYTEIKDLASYRLIMTQLKKITKKLIDNGFQVYYHNHAHEFSVFNNEYLLDKLLKDIPELRLELDVYWAYYANVDVHAYLNKHKSRIDFIHVKGMEIYQHEKSFTSVGEGVIDYASIYDLGLNCNYWIVENDRPKDDPFDNTQRSIKYIKKIIKGDES
ncbi:MAG: sugar phosphate isomerase/epimerase [Acholeplasmataceae bacterium]|nr:sugar phosphate isomerase/epimerase [Acholeplasmataceae bacterium]